MNWSNDGNNSYRNRKCTGDGSGKRVLASATILSALPLPVRRIHMQLYVLRMVRLAGVVHWNCIWIYVVSVIYHSVWLVLVMT
jgi:hypothetical protein